MIVNKDSNYVPVTVLDDCIYDKSDISSSLRLKDDFNRLYESLSNYFRRSIDLSNKVFNSTHGIFEYRNLYLNSYKSLFLNVNSDINIGFILCVHRSKIKDYQNKILDSNYYIDPKYFKFFINPKYLNNSYNKSIYNYYISYVRPLLISKGIDIIECEDYSFLFHILRVKIFNNLNDYKFYLKNIGKNVIKYIHLNNTILKKIRISSMRCESYVNKLDRYFRFCKGLAEIESKKDKLHKDIENEKLQHDSNISILKSLSCKINDDSDEELLKFFNAYINDQSICNNSYNPDNVVYSTNHIFKYFYIGDKIYYELTQDVTSKLFNYSERISEINNVLNDGEPSYNIMDSMLNNLKQN